MKAVTIYVTDATAKQIVRLAKTGHVTNISDAAYSAFKLLSEHACSLHRGGARVVHIAGYPYFFLPERLSYSRRSR